MKIAIEKKYLTFPINTSVSQKRILFRDDSGELVFDLEAKLDAISPNFTAYIDVSHFKGMTLNITSEPDMNYEVGATDVYISDDVYKEPIRPRVHFSVKNGWNNDPNGLIKMNGKYHMFFQYNPCSAEWGNMHWGHAVSQDLIHWRELDCALFPDRFGTMYSGSAIEDNKAVCPLGCGNSSKMLLYYTAAGNTGRMSAGEKFTQRLAYSEDGIHFKKYDVAPMIPHIEGGNRDPKVVWVDELSCYILALYLDGNRFTMYRSDDLLNWEHFQDFTIPSDRECPDIYPLHCEKEKLWVISAASDYYIVGKFCNGRFITLCNEKRLSYNSVNYAAQSFSGLEGGRAVRVYWHRTHFPSPKVTQQMSIPVEMSLRRELNGYHLFALPIKELECLRDRCERYDGITLSQPVRIDTKISPLDITINAEYAENAVIHLNIFGTAVTIDTKNNCVRLMKSKMPLSMKKDSVKLRVIVDVCTIELYADDGRYLMTEQSIADPNLPYLMLSADKPVNITSFEVYTLRSAY
ncbi:MAG: glycoside hydrolase family 32 protein [Clostridia bacterium]|nr:glycoside hydrolase family 32 protein [Clostridia bacterium]